MVDQESNMDERSVLYYPAIMIPEETWLRQVILYWDRVSSIVPMRYEDYSNVKVPIYPFSHNMQYLLEEGVFVPIDPASFTQTEHWWERKEELVSEMLSIVDSDTFRRALPSRSKMNFDAAVHRDKISDEVVYELGERDLVDKATDDLEWHLMEQNTGMLYMSLLAKYLSDIQTGQMLPATDSSSSEGFLFNCDSTDEGLACLDVRYFDCLPIPRNDVSYEDILHFKRKKGNRMALLKFRKQLNELHDELSKVEKLKRVDQVLGDFKLSVELGLHELREALNDSRLATVSGSFKTIICLKSPTLWGAAVVVAGKATKLAEVPIELAASGIGIAGVIQIADHLIHKRNDRRKILRESDFAYLYHAESNGII